jgi:hypothetical protein
VKKFQMGIMGAAAIEKQKVVMQSTGRQVGRYEMFSASMILPQQSAFTTYDVVNGDARVEFQKTASVPSSCVSGFVYCLRSIVAYTAQQVAVWEQERFFR